MITLEVWALILGFAVPMIISPGPGNTILAACGGKFGVRGSVPFWMGCEAANLLWCLIYGFGLSQLVASHPATYTYLKWGGTLYIIYLAYCFFSSSSLAEEQDLKPLGFADGFLSLSLNPKAHSMILVMFSQFINPHLSLVNQVLQITMVFIILCFGCHFLWVYGGKMIFGRLKSKQAIQAQNYVFGACMLVVAVYMALN